MSDPAVEQDVALLTALGRSTRDIEAATGLDHATVARWQSRDHMRHLTNEYREMIALRLSERLWRLVDDETQQISPQQLGVLWGISQDKLLHAAQDVNTGVKITINVDQRNVDQRGRD